MKPGPKGKSPEQQAASGETRPSRTVVTMFADHASRPDPEHIPAPRGMTRAAKKIWEAIRRSIGQTSKDWTAGSAATWPIRTTLPRSCWPRSIGRTG